MNTDISWHRYKLPLEVREQIREWSLVDMWCQHAAVADGARKQLSLKAISVLMPTCVCYKHPGYLTVDFTVQ
jgi:predicted CoA-binding protein